MHDEVKKRVDNQDIRGLQYVFADCLDVDPTFEKYKEDFAYCRKMLPEMFQSHIELMPFSNNQADWTDDYWDNVKMDLLKNFSIERFLHMQEVAKVVYAEKMSRLMQERSKQKQEEEREAARRPLEQKNQHFEESQIKQENYNNVKANTSDNTYMNYTSQNMQVQQQIKSHKQKQEEELEAARRQLEQENQRFEENRAREQQYREQLRKSENIQVSGGTEIKKGMGAVLVIVVFLIIVVIIVMAIRN